MQLMETPLFSNHQDLRAKMAPFGQWNMPIQYSSIIEERNQCRTSSAIFDTCHMGILKFSGELKQSGFDFAVTNDVVSQKVGKCSYGFLLNEDGSVIDDLIVYKIGTNELIIVINSATIDKDVDVIRSVISDQKSLTTLSPMLSKIDLQGPKSEEVLKRIIDYDLTSLKYFSFISTMYQNSDLLISRTGYTGELGYELYISSEKINGLWQHLLSFEEVKPAGLGARDLLRLEVGLPLSGSDINETITPLEAGFGNFINFDKDFKGKKALLKQKENGVKKIKIAFETTTRRSPRAGNTIFLNEQEAGFVTSGIFSPLNNRGIGLGFIQASFFSPELTDIVIGTGRNSIEAKISELPFYKNGTSRVKL
jgi:aminomethyltransferase